MLLSLSTTQWLCSVQVSRCSCSFFSCSGSAYAPMYSNAQAGNTTDSMRSMRTQQQETPPPFLSTNAYGQVCLYLRRENLLISRAFQTSWFRKEQTHSSGHTDSSTQITEDSASFLFGYVIMFYICKLAKATLPLLVTDRQSPQKILYNVFSCFRLLLSPQFLPRHSCSWFRWFTKKMLRLHIFGRSAANLVLISALKKKKT